MPTIKLLLAGEGGQGVQTTAEILSFAAAEQNKEISYIPSFGVEQRGAPSVAFITIGNSPIAYPLFDKADIAVILQKRAISAVSKKISAGTQILFDSSAIAKTDLEKSSKDLSGLPASKLAFENFTPQSANILIMGKLSAILDLSSENTWKIIEKKLGKKIGINNLEKNRKAFLFGREFELEKNNFSQPDYAPKCGAIVFEAHGKKAVIIPEHCKGCGICIVKCPFKALAFGKNLGFCATPIPDIDLEKCTNCGICSRFCPEGAINVEKKGDK